MSNAKHTPGPWEYEKADRRDTYEVFIHGELGGSHAMVTMTKVCHLSTVTHAFRGTLLEVTPSYYVLDPEAKVALVDSTGSFSSYLAEMSAAREGDEFTPKKGKAGPTVRILRGAVSWMVSAP